jgi:hypothetical protein
MIDRRHEREPNLTNNLHLELQCCACLAPCTLGQSWPDVIHLSRHIYLLILRTLLTAPQSAILNCSTVGIRPRSTERRDQCVSGTKGPRLLAEVAA